MTYPLNEVRDAEDALWAYLHATNGGGQVHSMDLFESREICARCGGGPRTNRKRGSVCMSCEQLWLGKVVPLLEPRAARRRRGADGGQEVKVKARKRHGRAQREAPAPVERAADLLLLLRDVIERRPQEDRLDPCTMTLREWRWDLRAFAVHANGHGRSYVTAAEEGERLWPGETKTRWWSERKVRDAVANVRRVVENRLAMVRHGQGRSRWGGGGSASRRQRGGSGRVSGRSVA